MYERRSAMTQLVKLHRNSSNLNVCEYNCIGKMLTSSCAIHILTIPASHIFHGSVPSNGTRHCLLSYFKLFMPTVFHNRVHAMAWCCSPSAGGLPNCLLMRRAFLLAPDKITCLTSACRLTLHANRQPRQRAVLRRSLSDTGPIPLRA